MHKLHIFDCFLWVFLHKRLSFFTNAFSSQNLPLNFNSWAGSIIKTFSGFDIAVISTVLHTKTKKLIKYPQYLKKILFLSVFRFFCSVVAPFDYSFTYSKLKRPLNLNSTFFSNDFLNLIIFTITNMIRSNSVYLSSYKVFKKF